MDSLVSLDHYGVRLDFPDIRVCKSAKLTVKTKQKTKEVTASQLLKKVERKGFSKIDRLHSTLFQLLEGDVPKTFRDKFLFNTFY